MYGETDNGYLRGDTALFAAAFKQALLLENDGFKGHSSHE